MKTAQKKTTSKETLQSICLDGLAYIDGQDHSFKVMPLIFGLMLVHPTNPDISAAASQYLSKWVKDCTSSKGLKDIISVGMDSILPVLQALTTKEDLQSEAVEEDPRKEIEQFFRGLPPAAKIAIRLHECILNAQAELSESRVLDRLNDSICEILNDIRTSDPKLNRLLGLSQFLDLTRDENSITIAS